MNIGLFNYSLDPKFIAQKPPKIRGDTNLLLINTKNKKFEISKYKYLYQFLDPQDLVILNNTKVIPARLIGKNKTGGKVELLILEKHQINNQQPTSNFQNKIKKGKELVRAIFRGNLKEKEYVYFENDPKLNKSKLNGTSKIQVVNILDDGIAILDIENEDKLYQLLEKYGHTPLPPYIKREDNKEDKRRYQTEFAEFKGSVAAPTASLNFTSELKNNLIKKGIEIDYLTLHCGYGTFKPVKTKEVEDHIMHSEYFEVSERTWNNIHKCKGHIVGIGTTVTRTLETISKNLKTRWLAEAIAKAEKLACPDQGGENLTTLSGEADIFIYPGFRFNIINKLVTNFHVPKGTPLILTTAFIADKLAKNRNIEISDDLILEARDFLMSGYKLAMDNNFKFFSYGDSCLIV